MKRFRKIQGILTIACVVVCLMGINYAYFTERLTMSSKIETANMKYIFSDGGNILNITLNSEATMNLLSLPKDEVYTLTYSLNSNNNNVPLKKIENKKISSISIDLKNLSLTQDGKEVKVSSLEKSSFVNNSIPNSLGNFDCYHDFDGVSGTIRLVKQSEPANLNLVINKNELNIEEHIQLGIEESLDEKLIIDNTIAKQDLEGKQDDKDKDKSKMKIVETIEIKEELKERAIININAIYGFDIPLEYDQFNVNAK